MTKEGIIEKIYEVCSNLDDIRDQAGGMADMIEYVRDNVNRSQEALISLLNNFDGEK